MASNFFTPTLADVLAPLRKIQNGLDNLQKANTIKVNEKNTTIADLKVEVEGHEAESRQAGIASKNLHALATIDLTGGANVKK